MSLFQIIIYSLVPMIILFIIINNAISTSNYSRRGFIMAIISFVVLLAFALAVQYDYYNDRIVNSLYYWLAAVILVGLLIGMSIFNIVKGKKYNHKIFKSKRKFEKDVSQFLYLLIREGGMYHLVKENISSDKYAGIVVPFSKGCYFYDEMLSKYIKANNIAVIDSDYMGTVTSYKKKKMIFYCFIVDVKECEYIYNLERVSPFEIHKLDMADFHKTIIMRILLKDKFNIEI